MVCSERRLRCEIDLNIAVPLCRVDAHTVGIGGDRRKRSGVEKINENLHEQKQMNTVQYIGEK